MSVWKAAVRSASFARYAPNSWTHALFFKALSGTGRPLRRQSASEVALLISHGLPVYPVKDAR